MKLRTSIGHDPDLTRLNLRYSAKKSAEKATQDLLAEEAGDTVTLQINVDKIQGKADNKYRLM